MEDGARQPAGQKYITCNADEGDSGTFSDRMIMEGDPFVLIEGMTIAGLAVGATRGYIYLRVEYPHALQVLTAAIAAARAAGLLGADVLGSGMPSTSRCGSAPAPTSAARRPRCSRASRAGAARFACARRCPPRRASSARRPSSTTSSRWRRSRRSSRAARRSTASSARRSRAAPCRCSSPATSGSGGLVERAFGLTLRELLEDYGGGSLSGRPIRAVQIGGPLGAYLPASQFDTPLDYEAFSAIGALLGHGGVVVFDDTVDMVEMARYAMEFCAHESCGKCTPCRIGSMRGAEVLAAIGRGRGP